MKLFHIENYQINTSDFTHILHDSKVEEFEKTIAEYVGAKYACGVSSATNAIFLALQNKFTTVTIPSIMPPVVANAILTSGNKLKFKDDIDWVGDSYVLHNFGEYKIIDSAQKIEKNQFINEANDQDLMIFSFYPTKPIGSLDGGMVVSNDLNKIKWFKEATLNGMSYSPNNWDRTIKFPGWKMYLNSIQAHVAYENFIKYSSKLNSLKQIRNEYNTKLGLNNTSNHLYRVKVTNNKNVASKLKQLGIPTGIHYISLHNHPIYNTNQLLPNSEQESQSTLSIPFHEKLTSEEINKVVTAIKPYIL